MARKLKVYGTSAVHLNYIGQCRAVCATTSWARFARLLDEQGVPADRSVSGLREYGSITFNAGEVETAMHEPETVFLEPTRNSYRNPRNLRRAADLIAEVEAQAKTKNRRKW
jgi:hypothetical protein